MRVPNRFLQAALCSLAASSALLALVVAAPAHATLIGGPGPFPGLDPDDGTELFVPNLNPIQLQHVVRVKEAADTIPGVIDHEWGIYFANDPGTLIPVFTTGDSGANQQAVISFNSGQVVDLDGLTVEGGFGPSLGAFGFYLNLHPVGAPEILRYSEPSLNPGGVDAVATFPFQANPTFYFVGFEIDDKIFSLEIVDGVVPVPEPGVAGLLGGGLAVLAGGRSIRRA